MKESGQGKWCTTVFFSLHPAHLKAQFTPKWKDDKFQKKPSTISV